MLNHNETPSFWGDGYSDPSTYLDQKSKPEKTNNQYGFFYVQNLYWYFKIFSCYLLLHNLSIILFILLILIKHNPLYNIDFIYKLPFAQLFLN